MSAISHPANVTCTQHPVQLVDLEPAPLQISDCAMSKLEGNKVVTKNDVAFGLRVSAVMASLSAEMKLPSDSISDIDSPWLCES